MASTIAAITTGIGGIVTTADATGNLSLLSGTSTVVAVTSAGAAVTGTMSVSGATTLTGGLNTPLAVTSGGTGVATSTGSGANVLGTSPTLTTPTISTITSAAATALTLQSASTTAVTIDTSQNVGIGLSNPASKLYVATSSTTAYGLISQTPVVGLVAGNSVNMAYITNSRGSSNDGLRFINYRDSTGSGVGNWETESYAIERNIDDVAPQASVRFGVSNLRFDTGGTERMRIDSSGNLQFNSGYGSVAIAYGCRAWVNFNGTGTVAIRASGNVSSITDNGTGDYTINFTTAMPDANYCAVSASSKATSSASENQVTQMFNYSTGSIRIGTGVFTGVANVTWTSNDQPIVCVSIFR